MNDADIREALLFELSEKHKGDLDTRIFNEFSLDNGLNRIDLVVLGDGIHGYEIKSDKDSLDRLFDQMRTYNLVFDKITLTICWRHFSEVMKMVPEWWGIQLACAKDNSSIDIYEFREPIENPQIDSLSLARLLWKDEAIEILAACGLKKGISSKNKEYVFKKLIKETDVSFLRPKVMEALRSRKYWKVDELHVSDDDLCLR